MAFRQALTISSASNKKIGKIVAKGSEIGLYAIEMDNDKCVIHLIRVGAGLSHKRTVIIHLVENILKQAIALNAKSISCTDKHCGPIVAQALEESGFLSNPEGLSRPILRGVVPVFQALDALKCHRNCVQTSLGDASTLLDIENHVWPAKIQELSLPTYVVPIQPRWAMRLLSPHPFQRLLIERPDVMTQTQRVYYRSSKRALRFPSRILWYVTGDRKTPSKYVIGTSLVEQVETGRAKELFKKYQRLGVYEWRHVSRVAKGDSAYPIMAIVFSKTELFDSGISYPRLVDIVMDIDGKNLNVVSPYEVSTDVFFCAYKLGVKA